MSFERHVWFFKRCSLLLCFAFLLASCSPEGGGDDGQVILDSNPPGATLDGNFGLGTGRVFLTAAVSNASAVVEDANGNLVVAGQAIDAQGETLVMGLRLLFSGEFDTSFGFGGVNSLDPSNGMSGSNHVAAVSIDGAGRIVIAGTIATATDTDIFVARFLEDGNLDLTFGIANGFVTGGNDLLADHDDMATGLAIDDAGRILVTGQSQPVGSVDPGEIATWRFLTIGLEDAAFAGGGPFLSGGIEDRAGSLLVDSTGASIIVGSRGDDLAMWLLDPDGELETGFGTGGLATISDPGASLRPTDLKIYNAFTVVITGRRMVTGEADRMFVTRVFGDGILDTNFGDNGFLTFASISGNSFGNSIAVSDIGQIVVTGDTTLVDATTSDESTAGALWLLTPNGLLDTSLAGVGVVHLSDSNDVFTEGHSVLIDSTNRIVISGRVDPGNGEPHALVWRIF